MGRRVRDVTTRDVITVDEQTPCKEIVQRLTGYRVGGLPVLDPDGRVVGIVSEAARLLHRHQVKRPPVVDPAGPLLGIISRADLLKVSLRASTRSQLHQLDRSPASSGHEQRQDRSTRWRRRTNGSSQLSSADSRPLLRTGS
jgi:CBS-domain-containing membrane protein